MLKRGQITLFMLVGIVIIVIFGLIYYITAYATKGKTTASNEEAAKLALDITPIKTYAETCLEKASEEGIWLVGAQGGYVDPDSDGNSFYGEAGNAILLFTDYQDDKVPYYLDETDDGGILGLDEIEEKLSKYIIVEFEKCLDLETLGNLGFDITQPDVDYKNKGYYYSDLVDSKVSINKEDVTVQIKYPLVIRKKEAVTELSDFRVSLPVRLGALYDSAANLIGNIISSQPLTYSITSDCSIYDTNGLTNIYFKDNKIIQFMDFKTYEYKYLKAYIFQFAIQDVSFNGECVG